MDTMEDGLTYFVYFSQQKIDQLYRQLPDARLLVQKASVSSTDHRGLSILPKGELLESLSLNGADRGQTAVCYREALLDKNDFYRLRKVLQALRAQGLLRELPNGQRPGKPCPGELLWIRGCFSLAAEDGGSGMAELRAPAREGRPCLRLCCCKQAFTADCGDDGWTELFRCGAPLPLRGVMLVLPNAAGQEDCWCGAPLFLAF
ncbi:MAG: hypothetical protein LBJ11_05775 [Oscillospiraceae bacterium]|nr:hypothetical protein [Oscillospiraceae bacterium]